MSGPGEDGAATARRPVVLVLIGAAWPGNDSSGPNQSVAALAMAAQDRFAFRFVARGGPVGSRRRATRRDWIDLGFATIRYCGIGPLGAIGLRSILRETPHDLLWMNSIFDREFTLPAVLMHRFGLVSRKPTLISPRGECGAGALGLKRGKKRIFLGLAPRLGFPRDVAFHATSDAEAADIGAIFGAARPILVAPNVRRVIDVPLYGPPPDGVPRLAFVGRISPVKRLDYLLDVLRHVGVAVTLDIFGPAQDHAYWRACEAKIADLPAHVRVTWHGDVPNTAIIAAMARTDLFVLPTAGENFGHAIFEALSCGVPVLVSDQTPWRDLATARAGWDLPLARPECFVAAIEAFAGMTETARAILRRGARDRAARWTRDSDARARNIAMIEGLLAPHAAACGSGAAR